MIKTILTTAFFLSCTTAFASLDAKPVTLNMVLEVNGKQVSKPQVIVRMGETAQITQKVAGSPEYSIQVLPTLEKNKIGAVRLAFVVSQAVQGSSENKVLGRPQFIVLNGHSATMETREPAAVLKLTVAPTF